MMHFWMTVAAEKSALKWLLGSFHPGIVHFPIGLLAAAGLLEGIQLLRRRKDSAPGTAALVYLSAASAVPAALFGFMLADHGGNEGPTLELHKWLGLASTVVALAAAGCAWKAKAPPLRLTVILGAALVLGTGYFGGELTAGEGHLLKPLRALLGLKEPDSTGNTKNGAPPDGKTDEKTPLQKPSGKVSFDKEIAPILKDMCFKCHGGEKVKGKLKLNTKALAMEGGQGGKAIIPGKPTISSLYTSLVADPESDQYMPPPKEKVRPTKEQIERIRKWIEEGADWPDGYELKK